MKIACLFVHKHKASTLMKAGRLKCFSRTTGGSRTMSLGNFGFDLNILYACWFLCKLRDQASWSVKAMSSETTLINKLYTTNSKLRIQAVVYRNYDCITSWDYPIAFLLTALYTALLHSLAASEYCTQLHMRDSLCCTPSCRLHEKRGGCSTTEPR
jgi:hypothetical protein